MGGGLAALAGAAFMARRKIVGRLSRLTRTRRW
jgi:hypothetical protein